MTWERHFGGHCLIQKIFVKKTGSVVDKELLYMLILPMLRKSKHPPKELLQDIQLTSDTMIITDYSRREERNFSVRTFTQIPEYWTYRAPGAIGPQRKSIYPSVGKRPSKILRKTVSNGEWGVIDILNELRELKYPQMAYHLVGQDQPFSVLPRREVEVIDNAYIRLVEAPCIRPCILGDDMDYSHHRAVLIERRLRFLNDFLDDVLITGKRLTWDWRVRHRTDGCMLGIVESSQSGEVLSQDY